MASLDQILLLRHSTYMTHFYDVVLDWIHSRSPDCLHHFMVLDLPGVMREWGVVRLMVPWLQDPVQNWSARIYDHVIALQRECDHRRIPVINRVENLANAGKAEAARRLRAVGMHTPDIVPIVDREAFSRDFCGLAFPLFVREDWGHGGAMLRADTPDQARALPIRRFRRPVAVELIDVRNQEDGLYRKYRYFACGPTGVPQHLQVSRAWITRGEERVIDDRTREEELAYLATGDHHEVVFQRAREALGLDMVAFDYGLDSAGEPVVWEANPFPHIQFGRTTTQYRNHAIDRSIGAMVDMYLRRAGLAVPDAIAAVLAKPGRA